MKFLLTMSAKIPQVINPLTNRSVNVGSDLYKSLVKKGVIKPVELSIAPVVEPIFNNVVEPIVNNVVEPISEPPIKSLLAQTMATIVSENKPLFKKELTQKQSDALFRKLLFEKLTDLKEPEPKKDKTKPTKTEKKKKKKKKYKIVTPPPSSDDSSDSD